MDQPISTQTSHHILAFSLETNNATSSPKLEQTNDNVSFPKKMSDDAKESDHQNHQVLQNKELSGRERLKRYREDIAGQTSVPEKWSQESLLKEWMDYSTFDKLLAPSGLDLAREALIAEGRRAKSQRLRVESRC